MVIPTQVCNNAVFVVMLDIIVGAPSKGYNRGGAAYVFTSTTDGWITTPYRVYEEDLDERFSMYGAAVAGGNFNGDSHRDVVIGAPGYDNYRGRVDVMYGTTASKLPPSGYSSHLGTSIMGKIQTNKKQAWFGRSLAVGRMNGDIYDDLIVGAPMDSHGSCIQCGVVYIYYGSSSGLVLNNPTILVGEQMGSNFGFSVAVGGMLRVCVVVVVVMTRC